MAVLKKEFGKKIIGMTEALDVKSKNADNALGKILEQIRDNKHLFEDDMAEEMIGAVVDIIEYIKNKNFVEAERRKNYLAGLLKQ